MARKYQSHSKVNEERHTSKNIKSKGRKRREKKKKDKVLSLGFVCISLVIATIIFFAFFSIGVVIGPDIPI